MSTTIQNNQWSSTLLFILAATGSAVGLGNIWKFPYITAENGGGAFVLMYLFCILLVGIPTLIAEVLIGRRGRVSPSHCFEKVAKEANCSPRWRLLGLLGMLTSFLLLSYYCVIAGLSGYYTVFSLQGALTGLTPTELNTFFNDLQANPWKLGAASSSFLFITAFSVARGVNKGLEKLISYMVPFLFFLLIALVVYAYFTTDSMARTVNYLFTPRWQQISRASFLSALGHAFFTLSIATASMLIYGCYLSSRASLVKTALTIAFLDTLSAMLAGLAIFPIIFQYNLTPQEGPSLLFKVLPVAFASMPGGSLVGTGFFLLLLIAALGSSISMVEPIVAWLLEKTSCSRLRATTLTTLAIGILSMGSVLSFNVWQQVKLFGRWNFYTLIDNLVSLILLPLGGLLIALFAGWKISAAASSAEINTSPQVYAVWRFASRFIVPVAVLIIVYTSL